jgi:hypothetical protein
VVRKEKVKRVLITNPRSGTHYLKALISSVLGHPPLERTFANAGELQAAFHSVGSNQLIYGHFHYAQFWSVLDTEKLNDLRILVLTRHPIDRLISQIVFTRAIGGSLPDSTTSPQQLTKELMLGLWDHKPWEDGTIVANYASLHNFYLRELVANWLKFRACHMVKFEHLIAHPFHVLTECLDYLQINARECDIRSAVRSINFETLSNGRRPGQVENLSHYRCGVPGEWRNVFSTEEIGGMRPKYATAFASVGYII